MYEKRTFNYPFFLTLLLVFIHRALISYAWHIWWKLKLTFNDGSYEILMRLAWLHHIWHISFCQPINTLMYVFVYNHISNRFYIELKFEAKKEKKVSIPMIFIWIIYERKTTLLLFPSFHYNESDIEDSYPRKHVKSMHMYSSCGSNKYISKHLFHHICNNLFVSFINYYRCDCTFRINFSLCIDIGIRVWVYLCARWLLFVLRSPYGNSKQTGKCSWHEIKH